MPINYETGHAVNIANFKKLIDECTPMVGYNPSNGQLTILSMTAKWTAGDTAHNILTLAMQNAKNPINAREILFAPLDKLVVRSFNYFKSTSASAQVKKDAKGLVVKITGSNVKVPKLPDGTPDPNHISLSHQSFVQRTDTFKQLKDLYASDVNYAPNEADLMVAALTTLYTAMKNANDTIGAIIAPVDQARITRDHQLYDKDTGMLDVAQKCKDYVRGLFGAKAPETKLVTRIKFRRPKKKAQ